MSVLPEDFDWWWGGRKDLFTCGNCWGSIGKASVAQFVALIFETRRPSKS
jgi:hypothetical protein